MLQQVWIMAVMDKIIDLEDEKNIKKYSYNSAYNWIYSFVFI